MKLLKARLAKCARVWSNARAFDQPLCIWSNAARFTNWSDALRIWPNAQIGQMRLTLTSGPELECTRDNRIVSH